MSVDVEIENKNENNGPGLCFLILLILGGVVLFIPESIVVALPVVAGASFLYFVWYLISEGHLANILGSMIVSMVLMAIAAAIPIIGWILLLLWIFYNIAKAFESIKSLLPDAFCSAVLYGCLLFPAIQEMMSPGESHTMSNIACGVVYVIAAGLYCSRLSQVAADTKQSLFFFSIMWLSVPIIALLIVSIVASLRAAFRTVLTPVQTVVKTPQHVSAHMRGDTPVSAYTRTVTSIKTIDVAHTLPGAGAVGAGVVGSVSQVSTPGHSQALPMPQSKTSSAGTTQYATNKEHSFYRYDGLNREKIGHFLQAVQRQRALPPLSEEDILFYFDETVFGHGDRGVVLTDEGVYCVLGKLYETFYVRFDDIKSVTLKGALNKDIVLHMKNGQKHRAELTQSNAGAKKIYELICIAIEE
jgi:hypothetical protein